MNEIQFKKLQDIYTELRQAEKLVPPELPPNYTPEDVSRTDKSFTEYYCKVEDIRVEIGKLLDELMGK